MRHNLIAMIVGAVALVGCAKNSSEGVPDAAITPDAFAGTGCPVPTEPLAAGTHILYLNTEGVTLTNGPSDSRLDSTDLVVAGGAVVPPFLDGVAGRRAFIDQIVTLARGVLAPYSLDIVTTRPASGDYYMAVLGGDPVTVTGGCAGCDSQTEFSPTCATLSRDAVDLIFDHGMASPFTATVYASSLLSDLGVAAGLPSTTAATDCQCRIDTCTDWGATLCAYGSNAPTTMMQSGTVKFNCGITPTEDEPAQLKAALGCR